jgi:hypothetical protein
MEEIEKKVDAMIDESTMNEYKAYKTLVKHKKRINRVFSEVCGENSFHSRHPGIDKKAPAIAVASCSVAPPKAPEENPRRTERTAQMKLLLLRFVLRRRSLWNQANGSAKRLKLFQMSKFRQLQAWLS